MSAAPPVFLIVDDHALYRAGLAMTLAQAWPGAVLCQAGSLAEGLDGLHRLPRHPSLILLDVRLPDGNGLRALPTWQAESPGTPIVLMSAEVDAVLLGRAREAGANGFLHKSATMGEVLASLQAAIAGEPAFATLPYAVLTPQPAGPVAQVARDAAAPFEPSPLQSHILQLLGRGTPNKAIARQVGLQEMQVRAEVSWLTEALGASSREEAFRKAVDLGWVAA